MTLKVFSMTQEDHIPFGVLYAAYLGHGRNFLLL